MAMILGIDEVGRGCWAGPLVAGGVVLAAPIPGLRDSKRLSALQRERLAPLVHTQALGVGLGWVAPQELDAVGMTAAVRLAMLRAVEAVAADYDRIIIDGSINFLLGAPIADRCDVQAMIKADDAIPAVSAASIVAKVARDAYMQQAAAQFPEYGFDAHVGYGTARHQQALRQFGPCVLHRRSFRPVRMVVGCNDG